MEILICIVFFAMGLVLGMYATSQIGRSIDRNINTKNLKNNLENYESFIKKYYKINPKMKMTKKELGLKKKK